MAEKENITDLCKEALIQLADFVGDYKALLHEADPEAFWSTLETGKKLKSPGSFIDLTEYKGWKIVRGRLSRNFVLLDPDAKVLVKYWFPSYFQNFLKIVIELAPKYPREKSSMKIYQVVTDEGEEIKEDCERLTEEEAVKKFPNSIDLGSGFFTIHPKDKTALVPLETFFFKIASNQQNECVELLCKMGAKSVHITTFDESKDIKGGQIKAGSKELNFETGMSITSELEKCSELKVNFKGISDFTPDILEKSVWFKTNQEMKSILKLRLAKNTVIERDITTEVNETFKFDFRAAANVLDVAEVGLKINYEKATKQKRNFHVIFGD